MNVWRIGSYWDADISHVFKEHSIAFAGREVAAPLSKVKPEDLVAITSGQQIIGVGKVAEIVGLVEIDASYPQKYADVNAIKFSKVFFREDFPSIDFGMYDGQGKQFHQARDNYLIQISNLFTKLMQMETNDQIRKLLEYKKQIILQGPPGTGKTYNAKLIAKQVAIPTEISINELQEYLKIGLEIKTSTGYSSFYIVGINPLNIEIKLRSTGSQFAILRTSIAKAYKEKIWTTGEIRNGDDTYTAAMAKYIYENIKIDDVVKLIQFHPAYTYEDFVRGITVQSNGNSIEYKTENKILAKIAKVALDNYLNSKKEPEQLSRQNWINTKLTSFIELLSKELTENGKIALTSKGFVYEIEDDCLRYKGEDWATPGRINLVDLIKLIEANFGKTIGELIISKEVSVHAWYRTSYYLPILSRFFSHAGVYTSQIVPNEVLKSYVLIIDEINRANLPAVLGELIYALEYREEKVDSMYEIEGEGNKIVLPRNLYIIGTMNTADRSVGHIDYAIRRRFAFVDVLPKPEPIKKFAQEKFEAVSSLFIKNYKTIDWSNPLLDRSEHLAQDFRPEDVWIGHSYFITKDYENDSQDEKGKAELQMKMKYEVVPILKEYLKDGILLETARAKIEEL